MASIFGDDGVDDLFNDNIQTENEELPGEHEGDEQLFGDERAEGDGDNVDGDGDGDGEGDGDGKPIKVEPKKRAVRNPRPRLTVDTLSGPRGIQTIEDYFKDIKYKGKGYEKHDLDEVLRRLQHWAHRMYPTYTFDDVLNNIERLGKKKPLQVHMSRYRLGMLESLKPQHAADEAYDDEDVEAHAAADEPYDEFDALLGEQIAISKLAPRTPASTSHYHAAANTTAMSSHSTIATPKFQRGNMAVSTPFSTPGTTSANGNLHDISDLAEPLPPSLPTTPAKPKLSAEQMARIAENRRLAQQRKMAKILQQQQQQQNALPTVTED